MSINKSKNNSNVKSFIREFDLTSTLIRQKATRATQISYKDIIRDGYLICPANLNDNNQ